MTNAFFNVFGAVAICNIMDGLMTHIGLMNQLIEESNPFMRLIWELDGGKLFILLKLALSLCIFLVGFWLQYNNKTTSRSIQVLISGALLLYIYILCLHVTWVVHVFAS